MTEIDRIILDNNEDLAWFDPYMNYDEYELFVIETNCPLKILLECDNGKVRRFKLHLSTIYKDVFKDI